MSEKFKRSPVDQKKALIQERRKAYRKVLGGNDASTRIVIEDLKRFCRFSKSCFDPDPRIHADLEGRREVILRITEYLELDVEQLYLIYEQGAF